MIRMVLMITVYHVRCAYVKQVTTEDGIDLRKTRVSCLMCGAWFGIHPKRRREDGARRFSLKGRKKKEREAFRGLW